MKVSNHSNTKWIWMSALLLFVCVAATASVLFNQLDAYLLDDSGAISLLGAKVPANEIDPTLPEDTVINTADTEPPATWGSAETGETELPPPTTEEPGEPPTTEEPGEPPTTDEAGIPSTTEESGEPTTTDVPVTEEATTGEGATEPTQVPVTEPAETNESEPSEPETNAPEATEPETNAPGTGEPGTNETDPQPSNPQQITPQPTNPTDLSPASTDRILNFRSDPASKPGTITPSGPPTRRWTSSAFPM